MSREYPDRPWVGIGAIAFRGDTVLLVRRARPPRQGLWSLPGGAQHLGEGAEEAARRELREETGLLAASMTHVGRLFQGYGYSTQAYDVFLASGLTTGERDLDAEEAGLIARAFPFETVLSMIVDGTIRDASTVAALGLLRLKGLL